MAIIDKAVYSISTKKLFAEQKQNRSDKKNQELCEFDEIKSEIVEFEFSLLKNKNLELSKYYEIVKTRCFDLEKKCEGFEIKMKEHFETFKLDT